MPSKPTVILAGECVSLTFELVLAVSSFVYSNGGADEIQSVFEYNTISRVSLQRQGPAPESLHQTSPRGLKVKSGFVHTPFRKIGNLGSKGLGSLRHAPASGRLRTIPKNKAPELTPNPHNEGIKNRGHASGRLVFTIE